MREAHIVPLSRQPIKILRDLHPITGRQCYVFPAICGSGRPLCEVRFADLVIRAMK
jgi:integrase